MPSFSPADIKDHVWPFNAFYRRVQNFAHTANVFVVNRVALGFADFLENDLLGNLRGDSPQSFRRFQEAYFAADFGIWIDCFGFIQRNFQLRIFNVVF